MVKKELQKDKRWVADIEAREEALDRIAESSNWERYTREYRGDYSDVLGGSQEVLPLNLVYSFVRSKTPDLYLQDPYFEFTPKKRTTIGSAKLKEIAVNDLWHRKKFKREIKKGIQDGLIVGHGWYKVGYNANLGNIEEMDTTEFNSENEDYFLYRVNWRHILFNAESVDPPYDATWIAQKFFIPLSEAQKKYKSKTAGLPGMHLSAEKREDSNRTPTESADDGSVLYAELYEVWDKVNKKILVVSKHNGVLEERDWPYTKMQGFPFLFLNLSYVNDRPYGISDVGMGEAIVLEKTKMRSAFLGHLKRGNRQIMTPPDNFTPEAKEAYERGDDSALLDVEKPENVRPIPYAPFQNDVFGLESRLDDDLSQIWGQRPPDRSGQARTQTRTKFELQAQSVGTTNRLVEQQNVIQDIVEEAAEKLSSLLEEYATEPYYVSLTGQDPAKIAELLAQRASATSDGAINSPTGVTITNDDIKGPVDVRIKQGSAVPLDKASKLQVLEKLAGFYVQLQGQEAGPFLAAITKSYVEEIGLHDLTEAIEQEIEFIAARKEEATEAQRQQEELIAGQESSKLQLKAEEIAIDRQKVESNTQMELMGILKDMQLKIAELNSRVRDNENV